MKRWRLIIAVLAFAGLVVLAVLPYFAKAKAYSGPGIYGNVYHIQKSKEEWLADRHTNQWPTAKDLFPGLSPEKTLQDLMRPRRGEIYFINQTGAPPFAYVPKARGQYSGGEILVLTSDGVAVVYQ